MTGDNPQALDTKNAPRKSDHRKRIQSVWFDAWRYHAEAVPVVALLQEMRAQLAQKDFNAKRLREVAVRGALLSLDELTKKIGFQYAKFQQASQQWDAENLAATLPSDSLRENLQETIRLLLPEAAKQEGQDAKSRLVVFVDDLDRCEPEAAYRLLEGLKVYLTLNNCVFVLGLNQKAVEGAIANRLAGGLTNESARNDAQARAASYLEKICQNVWHLPIVDAPGKLLCELVADTGDVFKHHVVWLREVVGQRPCLPPNPRKIKGLANLVARLCLRLPTDLDANQGDRGRDEMRKLLIVAYVHQFHHDLFVRWQADPSLYNAIAQWCRREVKDGVLDRLRLPISASDDKGALAGAEPAAGADERSEEPADEPDLGFIRFPDPADANVFWIADIVRDLTIHVALETLEPYLAGKAA